MTRFCRFASAVFIFAAAGPLASAAGDPQAAAEPGGEPELVVVSALRLSAPAPAASVAILERADIERIAAPTAFEALRGLAGLSLAQNGGPGQPAAVFLRGASGSNQTLVLIDGAPVNDPSAFGGFNFAFLDAEAVERIEILRGAGAAIWGSEAIGGVVSITTRRDDGLAAAVEAGSFGSARGAVSGGETFGPLHLTGGADVARTGGFSAFAGGTEKDGSRSADLFGRVRADLGAGFSVDGGARTTRGFAQFDGFGADSADIGFTRQNLYDSKLQWRGGGGRYRLSAQGLYARTERRFPGGFFDFFAGERVLGRFEAEAQWRAEAQFLIGYDVEGLTTRAAPSFAGFAGGRRDSQSLFALYRGRFFDRATFEGAIRHENEGGFGQRTTGEAGARLGLGAETDLIGRWSQGFRAPSIDELTGGGFARPNRALRPEQSSGWEIGFEHSHGGAALSATFFARATRDQILFDVDPISFDAIYRNLARNRARGVELAGHAQFGALRAGASYSFLDAVDQATGLQNLRIPRHQGAIDLDWTGFKRLSFGGRLFVNGRERDFGGDNAGFVRLDLHARYRLSKAAEMTLRVENAADKRYQDVAGFGAAGLSGYLGVRLRGR